jgi:PTS system nitrogen regulatory IIA component
MDLKLKDVADLLNVSETTIRRWLAEGKIPSYRLNHQYRFARVEIENWMLERKLKLEKSSETESLQESPEYSKKGWQQFCLFRAIHKGAVVLKATSESKEKIIQEVMEETASILNLDAEVLTELLLDREKMMPTALNHGVAVPHTRDFLLKTHHDVLIVVHLDEQIDWGALDHKPVHTLFFLFACDDKHHLNLLAKLAHLSSDADALQFLQTQPSKERLLEFIKNWETGVFQPA